MSYRKIRYLMMEKEMPIPFIVNVGKLKSQKKFVTVLMNEYMAYYGGMVTQREVVWYEDLMRLLEAIIDADERPRIEPPREMRVKIMGGATLR
jgi:hypothetical protein